VAKNHHLAVSCWSFSASDDFGCSRTKPQCASWIAVGWPDHRKLREWWSKAINDGTSYLTSDASIPGCWRCTTGIFPTHKCAEAQAALFALAQQTQVKPGSLDSQSCSLLFHDLCFRPSLMLRSCQRWLAIHSRPRCSLYSPSFTLTSPVN
jgi:hypothetical protein